MNWQDKLSGEPHVFAIDYINDYLAPEIPVYETVWAKYSILITFADMQEGLVAHRERILHLAPNQVQLAYIAVNHAQPPTQLCGLAERDMVPADPFMHFSDGSIPMADCGPEHDYCKLYDYRTDAWRTMFLESVRETLYGWKYDGVMFDNANVWSAALENNDQQVKREMQEALQDAFMTLRGRYPHALFIGNSDIRLAGLNGEMCENRPHDFLANCRPFAGHAQPEMNFCTMYSTTQTNIFNAWKAINAKGGWFCAQKDVFTPSWYPFYLS